MSDVITVAMIEDDARLRSLLRLMFEESPGFRLVGEFSSVELALATFPLPPPDVVLLDVHLPGVRGSAGVKLLREKFPTIRVLMLTVYAEDDLVFEAICNGAVGYMLKRTAPQRLLEAIVEAQGGGAPMSPEIARRVMDVFRTLRPSPPESAASLSPQESRLLRLLADGHSYESAGANLEVTINTVRKHVRSIYEKLHVHSKSEAVSKAIRSGLI